MTNLSILQLGLRVFGGIFVLLIPVMKLNPLGGWAWTPSQGEYELMI